MLTQVLFSFTRKRGWRWATIHVAHDVCGVSVHWLSRPSAYQLSWDPTRSLIHSFIHSLNGWRCRTLAHFDLRRVVARAWRRCLYCVAWLSGTYQLPSQDHRLVCEKEGLATETVVGAWSCLIAGRNFVKWKVLCSMLVSCICLSRCLSVRAVYRSQFKSNLH